MKILAVQITFGKQPHDETDSVSSWDITVLVEGQVNDVAAYQQRRLSIHVDNRFIEPLAEQAFANGRKLTENEALKYFNIPAGKHYRR